MTPVSDSKDLPDFTQGIAPQDLGDGKILGRVGDSQVLLVRTDSGLFAVDSQCSHYHGPLAEGLVVADSIRCPWHHACFDLRTGEAMRAPALAALSCWKVEQVDGRIFVREKQQQQPTRAAAVRRAGVPERVVIVGGGAAGFACAEMLRRQQFGGSILIASQEAAAPVDRPNLSKDYLSGEAPEDWLPLRSDDYYKDERIELRLNSTVTSVDALGRKALLSDGTVAAYDALVLACGAEPIRLTIPGADRPNVYTLRSLADCRAIIKSSQVESSRGARRALVIGGSFIGLEAAAALRKRGVEVHVVTQDKIPMARIFGADMGNFVRALHEEHGVVFHLESEVMTLGEGRATLRGGKELEFDFVVVGIGVRPRLALADQIGVTRDRGVLVDAHLQTNTPGIYAAGDIARWPDPHSGDDIRVEHWVVAQRQGQTVARNILGQQEAFKAVPFFWSQHYDVALNYVGHAERWDELVVEGDIKARDCLLKFKLRNRTLAVASIFRDLASLHAELVMEREIG